MQANYGYGDPPQIPSFASSSAYDYPPDADNPALNASSSNSSYTTTTYPPQQQGFAQQPQDSYYVAPPSNNPRPGYWDEQYRQWREYP